MGEVTPKALLLLAGEPLLVHAVRGLRACAAVGPIVVAAPADRVDEVASLLAVYDVTVIAGGAVRQQSVAFALAALPHSVDTVLVHDAARALTPLAVIDRVLAALAAGADAVIPVLAVHDTLKQVASDAVLRTVDRADLRAVQTPQGFLREVLELAHAAAPDTAGDATDDAALVELLGRTVRTVPGAEEAFKVTRPYDLRLAEALLAAR